MDGWGGARLLPFKEKNKLDKISQINTEYTAMGVLYEPCQSKAVSSAPNRPVLHRGVDRQHAHAGHLRAGHLRLHANGWRADAERAPDAWKGWLRTGGAGPVLPHYTRSNQNRRCCSGKGTHGFVSNADRICSGDNLSPDNRPDFQIRPAHRQRPPHSDAGSPLSNEPDHPLLIHIPTSRSTNTTFP